jgi:hypothetical protein
LQAIVVVPSTLKIVTIDRMADYIEKLRNKAPQLDLIFGIRAWGLILYGALPASLALLGILEVKVTNIGNSLPFLVPVSLLPLLITFLLIRSRNKDWYLTTKLLNIRSLIVTGLIVLCATFISGASGIIHGRYSLLLSEFGSLHHITSIAESFLIGIGSLVLTSTLFLTILTKDSNLPGLPSSDFVKALAEIRGKLKQLQSSSIWHSHTGFDGGKLIATAQELEDSLEKITNYPGNNFAKSSLEPVRSGISHFINAVSEIQKGGNDESKRLIWAKHFMQSESLEKHKESDSLTIHASPIHILNQLSLGK